MKRTIKMMMIFSSSVGLLLLLITGFATANPDITREIYIAPSGDPTLGDLATELITYTDQIDTAAWQTTAVPFADQGILLALTDDTTAISISDRQTLNAMGDQAYLLDINSQRVLIVGNSMLAVQHGMFDFLEQMGIRFLAPPEAWQIVPQDQGLDLTAVKRFEEPDVFARDRFFSNGNGWLHDENSTIDADNENFYRQSRMGSVMPVNFGHTYDQFIADYRPMFEDNANWLGMKEDGSRYTLEEVDNSDGYYALEYCNTDLAAFIALDRIAELQQMIAINPDIRIVSMEPNDGAKPSYSPECEAAVGSIQGVNAPATMADQVVYFVNQVAVDVQAAFPDLYVYVGTYAYNEHIGPPKVMAVEDNVYIQITMGFNTTEFSFNELVSGWKAKGANWVGIYDYNELPIWDYGLPGAPSATLDYVDGNLPYYVNNWNVHSIQSETSADWGRVAPSMYLYWKLAWDADADSEAIYNDFFVSAYGDGADEMRTLFDMWENLKSSSDLFTYYKLPLWLAQMDSALAATENESPAVRQRMDDMLAYLHFVTLYYEYSDAERDNDINPAPGQAAKIVLMNYVWRTRNRQMIQIEGILDESLTNQWQTPDGAYTHAELVAMFENDRANHPVDTRWRSFSDQLMPLSNVAAVPFTPLPPVDSSEAYGVHWESVWYVQVDSATDLQVDFSGTGAPARRVWVTDSADNSLLHEGSSHFLELEEGDIYSVTVTLPSAGVYRFEIETLYQMTIYPEFSPAVKYVYEASAETPIIMNKFTPAYFYVPEGTENLVFYHDGNMLLKAPSWENAVEYGYYISTTMSVPVGDDDGKVWQFGYDVEDHADDYTHGSLALLNIPPYLATAPENLLVPNEVIAVPTNVTFLPIVESDQSMIALLGVPIIMATVLWLAKRRVQ